MKREIRRKGTRRLFDQSEDTEMERLRIAGYSLASIAKTFHRAKSSVQIRLNLLAEWDENDALSSDATWQAAQDIKEDTT